MNGHRCTFAADGRVVCVCGWTGTAAQSFQHLRDQAHSTTCVMTALVAASHR